MKDTLADRLDGPGAIRRFRPQSLAWVFFAFVLVASASSVVVQQGGSAPGSTLIWNLVWAIILSAFTFVGAFILQRRPGHTIGWLLLIPGLAAIEPVAVSRLVEPPAEVTLGVVLSLWVHNYAWLAVFFPIIVLLTLFPTGRPLTPRWRWHTRAMVGMAAILIVLGTLAPEIGPLDETWTIDNPVGVFPNDDYFAWFGPIWSVALMAVTVASLASVVLRYRRAGPVEREQLKWLLYAFSIFAVVYLVFILVNEHVSGIVVDLMFAVALLIIPIAIMVAILRYRLFDIDVIVRRTVVYAIVTALLAATYAGSVVVFQSLLRGVASVDSSIGVAASTLLVAVLFSPLRRRTQGVVARRFFRAHHDARAMLAGYGTRARYETDVTELTQGLVDVVAAALHPDSISVWLMPEPDAAPAVSSWPRSRRVPAPEVLTDLVASGGYASDSGPA